MRIDLFKNGLIDDLVVQSKAVRITRSGEARCRIQIRGEADLEIEVWTTRKSSLQLQQNEPPPQWIDRVAMSGEGIVEVVATECLVHLEQMDRRSYWLGLSREHDQWGLNFLSPAYAKARMVQPSKAPG
jgi:hypothetical protein